MHVCLSSARAHITLAKAKFCFCKNNKRMIIMHVCLSSARAHITPLPPASCSDDMLSSRDVFLSAIGLLRLLTFTHAPGMLVWPSLSGWPYTI